MADRTIRIGKVSSVDYGSGMIKVTYPDLDNSVTDDLPYLTFNDEYKMPKVGASDDGTWRRLIVIPFGAKIQGKSDIKNYTDYLVENASPYIMTWVIEGAKKAIDAGFKLKPPKCVQDAINAYREGNDWLSHFLEECCEIGDSFEQKSGELYQEYRAYCFRNGEYTRSTTDFYSVLESAGYTRQKKHAGSFVHGLKLKGDFAQ